jgi:protein involved in polysaccharide export with SLBB domain
MSSFLRLLAAAVAVCALSAVTASAQNAPTPEQLELLNSLPAEQRDALIEQYTQSGGRAPSAEQVEFPDLVRPASRGSGPEDNGPLRVSGGETLVIAIAMPSGNGTAAELVEDRREVADLVGTRTYDLTDSGMLILPGVANVPLAGLLANEVALRLKAEPLLAPFEINVTILPLEKTGVEALDYFGYDLFAGTPTTFAPATDVPVPADYVMGPGDNLRIQYFGKENRSFDTVVSRDGEISLPEIGPLAVAGLTFSEMRQEIIDRVSEQKIGVRASITMGELRSIRIFVLGDVERPGSYVVSGLSTLTNALFVSGGVRLSGSLRDVQLKRNGSVVGRVDLYDLLLRGDTRGDRRLLPGDVIFVPPVGDRVGVEGEVNRPAYYELRGETRAGELIDLAGGLTPTAFEPASRLERISERGDRTIIDIDLRDETGRSRVVRDGDVLRVFPVLDRVDDSVTLSGHVRRPTNYEWRAGMRLTDVIPSPVLLKPQADLGYVVIRREVSDDGRITVLSADLAAAYANPQSDHNIRLTPRDEITVFPLSTSRGVDVQRLLEELERQGTEQEAVQKVVIAGRVRAPGTYPLEPDMRISDLLRAGGGFSESAYLYEAELTRYVIADDGSRETRLQTIDLESVLAGDTLADELLVPYDYLTIREIPDWRGQETIRVDGEVRFPGVYPIQRGETLRSVIQRAGGLTDLAFVDGSVFTRASLKAREEEQIDVLVSRLESDLAAFSLQAVQADENAQQAYLLGQSLLTQLRESEAAGRLVVDLGKILDGVPDSMDLTLRNGDRLIIPEVTQEVTVIGEVQYSTSHIFDARLDRDDYIGRSGGVTAKADADRIYVVRANGEVIANAGTKWFRRVGGSEIRPGDTIVVPIDADRLAPLTLWSSVTQIIYNLAISVAAVNSF